MATDHYRKTIEVLNAAQAPSTRVNALNKIFVATEDSELRIRLNAGIQLLRPAVDMRGAGKSLILSHQTWQDLIRYCVAQVQAQKPEWQVIAERKGWTPPAAKV